MGSQPITGAPPVPLLHCYDQPLREGPGDLPVWLGEVCCESQIPIAQHALINLPCLGSPTEPFDPVDPVEVNECGIADGALFGLHRGIRQQRVSQRRGVRGGDP